MGILDNIEAESKFKLRVESQKGLSLYKLKSIWTFFALTPRNIKHKSSNKRK